MGEGRSGRWDGKTVGCYGRVTTLRTTDATSSTAPMHASAATVARVGTGTSHGTFAPYTLWLQAPESKTLLAVMSEERKLHDVVRSA